MLRFNKFYFKGIRPKLSLVTFLFLAFITIVSSLLVLETMESSLLQELVKRGVSISVSAATPAGYSLLAGDQLGLDNLAAQIVHDQGDLRYLAILDSKGTVRAHNDLDAVGTSFAAGGKTLRVIDGTSLREVLWRDSRCYEFNTPILFAGKKVGEVVLGIDTDSLLAAKQAARRKIALVAGFVLVLGLPGTFFLATFITTPVKALAKGVEDLQAGQYDSEIRVRSQDELGQLTRSFNEMAQVIAKQNRNLAIYAGELEESFQSTVRILAASIDARDGYTLGHSSRVASLSLLLGKRLGLSQSELKDLSISCFLHDVGKIRVPDRILQKAGPLNQQEYRYIIRHPEHGAEILKLADSLHKYVPAVLHHHEWFNGEGYPAGLKGEEIPLFAAIVSIADAYDAMTSSRPYRLGLGKRQAVEEIRKYRGTQFAPELADLFIESLDEYQDESPSPRPILYGVA